MKYVDTGAQCSLLTRAKVVNSYQEEIKAKVDGHIVALRAGLEEEVAALKLEYEAKLRRAGEELEKSNYKLAKESARYENAQ